MQQSKSTWKGSRMHTYHLIMRSKWPSKMLTEACKTARLKQEKPTKKWDKPSRKKEIKCKDKLGKTGDFKILILSLFYKILYKL